MEKLGKYITRIFYVIVIVVLANLPSLLQQAHIGLLVPLLVFLFLVINLLPSFVNRKLLSKRLRTCGDGCELLTLFVISATITVIYSVTGFFGVYQAVGSITDNPSVWIVNILLSVLIEAVVFWNGIIRVYITSEQLGIRWRVIGIICGWIPVAHLVILGIILHTVSKEISFEDKKLVINQERKEQQICKTRYPILMVHGVFFRDFRYFNYWGRIPKELEENGATIYYGNQESAASVESCGEELAKRIRELVEETGCEKVNIIAHSKGGLDSRYAISMLGISSYVASLTTINTPHRGCEFADYLLEKIPQSQQDLLASTYNTALQKVGDKNPDFIEAVTDLTAAACRKRNETVLDVDGVYYQSVGSKLNHAFSGRFPLNFSYRLVNHFDGANDGLVGEKSFPWGERFQFLTVKGRRGISHGDMIDLNRENFDGFDVREFFVQLVADLKKKGY